MHDHWAVRVVAGIVLVAGVTPVVAAEHHPTHKAATPAAAVPGQPTADPQMEAMMAKWKEASTPGEGHQVLEAFIGNWDHVVKWQMGPEAPVEESTGTTQATWIMGGRFLEQKATGSMKGELFEGRGLTGYDNIKTQYQSVWIDNMGTGMMTSTGSYDPATKSLSDQGTFSCPMTQGEMAFRGTTRWIDANQYVYEMYHNDPATGKEFRAMEITYTRKP